jgi:competence protein ComEC
MLISFSILMAEVLVSFPCSWSRTLSLQWPDMAVIYLVFIAIYFIFKGYRKQPAVLLALAALWVIVTVFHNGKKIPDPHLTITIIDVGQGNSALIQAPGGKNMLVDGGGFSELSSFDTGRYIIAPFLWQKKIQAIESVILTHPESDHLNGLVFILQNFQVKTLIKNADKRNTKNYATLIQTCKNRNIRIFNPLTQKKSLDLGDTRLMFFVLPEETNLVDFNNRSLVFKLIYNGFSMLFPGDILSARETSLSATGRLDLNADILLSPHHGSATSSTQFFLDKVHPKSVIISCGWRNRYGFPHAKVLKRYTEMGIHIFRTDEDGAIFISSDGKQYDIKTNKGIR